MQPLSYFIPNSEQQLLDIIQQQKSSINWIAGGTDLMPNTVQGNNSAEVWIDLSKLNLWNQISSNENEVEIGALCNLHQIKTNLFIQQNFNALALSADAVASALIQKSATLGGNVLCQNRCIFYNQSEWWRETAGNCLKCNGPTCLATGGKNHCLSKSVSDTAVALISLKAKARILDKGNSKEIPVEELFSGNGIHPHTLDNGAILTSFKIPIPQKSTFLKLRWRKSLDFGSMMVAMTSLSNNTIRLALGGVDPKPLYAEIPDFMDFDTAVKDLRKKARSTGNDVFSTSYRKAMIPVYFNKAAQELGYTLSLC